MLQGFITSISCRLSLAGTLRTQSSSEICPFINCTYYNYCDTSMVGINGHGPSGQLACFQQRVTECMLLRQIGLQNTTDGKRLYHSQHRLHQITEPLPLLSQLYLCHKIHDSRKHRVPLNSQPDQQASVSIKCFNITGIVIIRILGGHH